MYITRLGKEKLYEEYLSIDDAIVDLNRKMGESAKIDNDLRENPEFMELRVKAMYELPARKKELFNRYKQAIVIEDMEDYIHFDGKTVILGSIVKVQIDGEIDEYKIVGTDEGNILNNELSCNAPIAQKIIGRKIGETIEYNGMSMHIISVKK
ncbi:MAG: GreA/GreB family elongation factor [Erysipelotrichales bacterium]|nr:GreA/GreB family elongation factor [Erysipelotrichales bacterium]